MRLRVRARQALFVFCLHLFTHRRQRVDRQCVRGEGFCASTFTRAAHAESGGEGRKWAVSSPPTPEQSGC